MLETIIVLAVLLWLLGMISSYTIGGLIHVLLVIARGRAARCGSSRADAWSDGAAVR